MGWIRVFGDGRGVPGPFAAGQRERSGKAGRLTRAGTTPPSQHGRQRPGPGCPGARDGMGSPGDRRGPARGPRRADWAAGGRKQPRPARAQAAPLTDEPAHLVLAQVEAHAGPRGRGRQRRGPRGRGGGGAGRGQQRQQREQEQQRRRRGPQAAGPREAAPARRPRPRRPAHGHRRRRGGAWAARRAAAAPPRPRAPHSPEPGAAAQFIAPPARCSRPPLQTAGARRRRRLLGGIVHCRGADRGGAPVHAAAAPRARTHAGPRPRPPPHFPPRCGPGLEGSASVLKCLCRQRALWSPCNGAHPRRTLSPASCLLVHCLQYPPPPGRRDQAGPGRPAAERAPQILGNAWMRALRLQRRNLLFVS